MSLPNGLVEAINNARQGYLTHPDKTITPLYRYKIYLSFFNKDLQNIYLTRGYLDILTAKKVLPIWKQLWADKDWLQILEESDYPQSLLKLAKGILYENYPLNIAKDEYEKYFRGKFNKENSPQAYVDNYYARFCANLILNDKELPEKLINLAEGYLNEGIEPRTAREELSKVENLISATEGWGNLPQDQIDAYYARNTAIDTLNFVVNGVLNLRITEKTKDWVPYDATEAAAAAVSGVTFEPHKKGGLEERMEFWEWWLTEAIPQAWELAEKDF